MIKELNRLVTSNIVDLRRYAHFATSGADEGDALLASTLRHLMRRSGKYKHQIGRRDLFRFVTELLLGTRPWDPDLATRCSSCQQIDKSNPYLSRLGIFLSSICKMNNADVAFVLGVSESELVNLWASCNATLLRGLEAKILVIEDDLSTAADISGALELLGHTVVGVARTKREALELFFEFNPGLLIIDLNLADGSSGIDAAMDVAKCKSIPMIFITSQTYHDQVGARLSRTIVMSKPIKDREIRDVVCQALFFDVRAQLIDQSGSVWEGNYVLDLA